MLFETLSVHTNLEIKAAKPDFAPALWELVQSNRSFLEEWMDWSQNLQKKADVERYLREMHLFNQGQQHYFWFIFNQEQLAGSIALLKRDKINRTAELAYWKQPQLLSKEDMQLTCRTMVQYIWKHDFIQRLEVQTLSLNKPAKKLAKALGFELEGCKRKAIFRNQTYYDLEIYGLLRP